MAKSIKSFEEPEGPAKSLYYREATKSPSQEGDLGGG